MGINTNELQNASMQWLRAMLVDDKRRAMLRALLDQYELPVIEMGSLKSQQIRKGHTAPRNFRRVNSAAT